MKEESHEVEIVRLLTVLVKRDHAQTELIAELAAVGFKPTRIADLLKTSPNTVNVTLSRLKNKN